MNQRSPDHRILVVNPGGISTKVALFDGQESVFVENIRHDSQELATFGTVNEQFDWRLEAIRRVLRSHSVDLTALSAVAGRGGPLCPVPSGTFAVDQTMLSAIASGEALIDHASLLGAPLAAELAKPAGCPAVIVDPVYVDEFCDASRLTGLPEIPRRALAHSLSLKFSAKKAARELNRPFEQINLITMHLGSGFTVSAQQQGQQIDSNDATASGPMSPTRAGSLPVLDFAKLCFSGRHTLDDIKHLLLNGGGWTAHLKTNDVRDIYAMIDAGDHNARTVLDATLLQLAKAAGAMLASLGGTVHGIVITGGVAYSERFVEELVARLEWIDAPVIVYPGENEMVALATGALDVLENRTTAMSMGPFLKSAE